MTQHRSILRGQAAEYCAAAIATVHGERVFFNVSNQDPWDMLWASYDESIVRRVQVKLSYQRKGYHHLTVDIIKTGSYSKYGSNDADVLAVVLPTFTSMLVFNWEDVYSMGRRSVGKLEQTVPHERWTL